MLLLAAGVGMGGGDGAVDVTEFSDLTTLFTQDYLVALNDADTGEDDNNTLVLGDEDTVRAGTSISEVDDYNTLYARYIEETN